MLHVAKVRMLMPVAIVLALAAGDGSARAQAPGQPPPPVTVAKPTKRLITEMDEYVGRFVAVDSVEVRARVSGYLESVHFKDGQFVKKGDLLFTIDRRPFEAALDQAKAALMQAKANLAYAESDLERGQSLTRGSTISEQIYEQRVQAKRVAEANVLAQQAAVRQAELDLEFTELRAPMAGHIGDRRVSPGNLVTGGTTGNTTLLATIVTTDPIRFEFTMDEASFLRYLRLPKQDAEASSTGMSLPVSLKLIDESDFVHQGRMDFIDNVIDRSSGTIRGRASFPNPTGVFTPGMFGRIRLPASPPTEALLVPDVAISTEQVRKFVFVVDDTNTVHQKYVTLGPVLDGQRVIKSGLAENDLVIVNGLMRARPGAKVTPQKQGAPASAASASGAPAKTN